MKVLSRFASPGGFALVLLLFFLLPFVSVSCDVPGYGDAGANYTGSHLVSGTDPEVPNELQELSDELRSEANDPDAPGELVDVPDPGVQVLAIVLAVLAVAGVLTVLVQQVRARLLGGAVVAAATLAVTVVTAVVAQSNLKSALLDGVHQSGLAEQQDMQRLETVVDDLTHTEVGFWLMVVLLSLITVGAGVLSLFGERLQVAGSRETGGRGGLGALSFGADDAKVRGRRTPDA